MIRLWQAVGVYFFALALLNSILTPLFLPFSPVSLSYFILAVPMRECLGKHSCMSFQVPIALNGTLSFLSLVQENINMPSGHYYIGFVSKVAVKNHLIKLKLNLWGKNRHCSSWIIRHQNCCDRCFHVFKGNQCI